jgi:hypothetical protein
LLFYNNKPAELYGAFKKNPHEIALFIIILERLVASKEMRKMTRRITMKVMAQALNVELLLALPLDK